MSYLSLDSLRIPIKGTLTILRLSRVSYRGKLGKLHATGCSITESLQNLEQIARAARKEKQK